MLHRLLALCFLIVASITEARSAGAEDIAEITRSVERLVDLFSDGLAVGYPEFRDIWFGKIFNSNLDDAVSLFSMEGFRGSNVHSEYLAFFAAVEQEDWPGHQQHRYQLVAVQQIGGRWWRSFRSKTLQITPGGVVIQGLAWSESDAGCCPSRPITATFTVKRHGIVESQ